MCNNQPYGFPSDVWSLGIVLYELLSLDVPFRSRDVVALVSQVRSQPIAPLSKIIATTKSPGNATTQLAAARSGRLDAVYHLWKVWAGPWEGGIDLKLRDFPVLPARLVGWTTAAIRDDGVSRPLCGVQPC